MRDNVVYSLFCFFLFAACLPPLYAPISEFHAEMYGDALVRAKAQAESRSPEEAAAEADRKREERNRIIMAKMSRPPVGVAHFDNPPDPQARAAAQRRREAVAIGGAAPTPSAVSIVSSLVGLTLVFCLIIHYLVAERRRRIRAERRLSP